MNYDDYESLPTPNLFLNMFSGGAAGLAEQLIVYPLDVIKTRMQSFHQTNNNKNISNTLNQMIKKEGLSTMLRGLNAAVYGTVPAHAFYFGSYELTKELLTKFTSHSTINYFLSAVIATIVHDSIVTPSQVIKQRMQMQNSKFSSITECIQFIYRNEGFGAFYRSFTTQVLMNIPYQSVHFVTYEFMQNQFNPERKYNPTIHMIAGGTAGSLAAAITTPLDVTKTLLNTQELGFTKGLRDAVLKIYSIAGFLGFFKGFNARVLHEAPSAAICWTTFEFFRFIFSGESKENYKSSVSGQKQLKPKDDT